MSSLGRWSLTSCFAASSSCPASSIPATGSADIAVSESFLKMIGIVDPRDHMRSRSHEVEAASFVYFASSVASIYKGGRVPLTAVINEPHHPLISVIFISKVAMATALQQYSWISTRFHQRKVCLWSELQPVLHLIDDSSWQKVQHRPASHLPQRQRKRQAMRSRHLQQILRMLA